MREFFMSPRLPFAFFGAAGFCLLMAVWNSLKASSHSARAARFAKRLAELNEQSKRLNGQSNR